MLVEKILKELPIIINREEETYYNGNYFEFAVNGTKYKIYGYNEESAKYRLMNFLMR